MQPPPENFTSTRPWSLVFQSVEYFIKGKQNTANKKQPVCSSTTIGCAMQAPAARKHISPQTSRLARRNNPKIKTSQPAAQSRSVAWRRSPRTKSHLPSEARRAQKVALRAQPAAQSQSVVRRRIPRTDPHLPSATRRPKATKLQNETQRSCSAMTTGCGVWTPTTPESMARREKQIPKQDVANLQLLGDWLCFALEHISPWKRCAYQNNQINRAEREGCQLVFATPVSFNV